MSYAAPSLWLFKFTVFRIAHSPFSFGFNLCRRPQIESRVDAHVAGYFCFMFNVAHLIGERVVVGVASFVSISSVSFITVVPLCSSLSLPVDTSASLNPNCCDWRHTHQTARLTSFLHLPPNHHHTLLFLSPPSFYFVARVRPWFLAKITVSLVPIRSIERIDSHQANQYLPGWSFYVPNMYLHCSTAAAGSHCISISMFIWTSGAIRVAVD